MKLHVFPSGPMCSIRRALLLWLVPLFLGVGAMGAVIIGVIGFMVAASLPQGDVELGVHDASVSEMQLYAVPPEEGIRDVEPPPAANSSAGTSDEELRGLGGVVHHG